jgi:ribonuclease HI
LGAKNLEVKSNSQVVVKHVQVEYKARGEKIKRYLEKVQETRASLEKVIVMKVPREDNTQLDFLACLGSGADEEIGALD